MNRLALLLLVIAGLSAACEENTHPPFAPLSPVMGRIRTGGGERGRDSGVTRADGSVGDASVILPPWCEQIGAGVPAPEVIELGEVERAIEFVPTAVSAKWSSLFCKPGGRRFLRISLVDSPACDLWSSADPVQELFLYVDVEAIRASELAPRSQPVGIDDDRIQVYYAQRDGRLWGLCDADAGGSIDFVSIGADDGDPITLSINVDLTDCAVMPISFPVRIDAELDINLHHTEAEACAPAE